MRNLLSAVGLTATALFLTADLSAQVRRLPNTGCPTAAFPDPVGSPQLGQGFGVVCPPCRSPAAPQALLLGTARRPVPIDPPLACERGCTLVVDALAIVTGSAWRTVVPRDPSLVGVCVDVQCVCIDGGRNGARCVTLSGALEACVQR